MELSNGVDDIQYLSEARAVCIEMPHQRLFISHRHAMSLVVRACLGEGLLAWGGAEAHASGLLAACLGACSRRLGSSN